jgi:hypothetical protein
VPLSVLREIKDEQDRVSALCVAKGRVCFGQLVLSDLKCTPGILMEHCILYNECILYIVFYNL